MKELIDIKQRFGIVGNSSLLNRAIEIACQVAPTDISVLITGESGSGKEAFSKIIHNLSKRKHHSFIAVNCGAIPEGTVDSELFGHIKGSFTSAIEDRKGYFEVVNGGTIFLDEVAELPLSTQARLLRVLETGEFIKVGSSKVQKTDVRIVAATNAEMLTAIQKGKFREDLYYRLNTVPLLIPPLRDRKEDIYLLFKKFNADFAEKYKSPLVQLDEEARFILENYRWPGNVRQLRNVAEQISVLEKNIFIDAKAISNYIPKDNITSLTLINNKQESQDFSERDILYKVIFDMRNDIMELKKIVLELLNNSDASNIVNNNAQFISKLYTEISDIGQSKSYNIPTPTEINYPSISSGDQYIKDTKLEDLDLKYSLGDQENELIKKALKKYNGNRKQAAIELGISERTLYRKIKDLNL